MNNKQNILPNFNHLFCFVFEVRIFFAILILPVFPNSLFCSEQHYFYTGKDFGSEATYNPFSYVLNGGFDILQCRNGNRDIRLLPYKNGFNNVINNLRNPFRSIRTYGLKEFINDEIFPDSFSSKNGQWAPNYGLHFIGGGMSYRAMKEWYSINGITHSSTFSLLTLGIQHLLNETIENHNKTGVNVDPIADIYIFDIAGVLVFNYDSIAKFFANTINLRDWSLQPTLTFSNASMHNVGQYFSFKLELPFFKENFVFGYIGMGGLVGGSHKFNNGKSLSVGIGGKTTSIVKVSSWRDKYSAKFGTSAGIFYDKEGSLLASILISDVEDYFCNINVYPGLFGFHNFQPGFWVILSQHGDVSLGITTKFTLNIGFESRGQYP